MHGPCPSRSLDVRGTVDHEGTGLVVPFVLYRLPADRNLDDTIDLLGWVSPNRHGVEKLRCSLSVRSIRAHLLLHGVGPARGLDHGLHTVERSATITRDHAARDVGGILGTKKHREPRDIVLSAEP